MQNFVRFRATESETELPEEFWGKLLVLSYTYPNCIIAISDDIYFAHKLLYNFTAPQTTDTDSSTDHKRFSPKVDRHQFMFR